VQLFFETYLVIALIFAIVTTSIAGSFLKNRRRVIAFVALEAVLGVVIPYALILFQRVFDSHAQIVDRTSAVPKTYEEARGYLLENWFGTFPSGYERAYDSFTHNLGPIILSVAAGIALGILLWLLLTRRRAASSHCANSLVPYSLPDLG
jgi:NhaP-type Na+/H+ or K+/H+ antiporter